MRPWKTPIKSRQTPVSFGVHGPGEIKRCVGAKAYASSTVILSLLAIFITIDGSIYPMRCNRLKVNES